MSEEKQTPPAPSRVKLSAWMPDGKVKVWACSDENRKNRRELSAPVTGIARQVRADGFCLIRLDERLPQEHESAHWHPVGDNRERDVLAHLDDCEPGV